MGKSRIRTVSPYPAGGAGGSGVTDTWPADQSGNGNDYTSETGSNAKADSVYFGPSNGYGSVANDASFDQLSAFTLVCNAMRYSGGGTGEIACLPAGPTWVSPYARIRIFLGSSSSFSGVVEDQANIITSANNQWGALVWTQIALTWDGSDGNAFLYADGVQKATGNIAVSNLTTTSQKLYIGDIGITPFRFSGEIGHIALYNVRKTAANLAAMWAVNDPMNGSDPTQGFGDIDSTGIVIDLRGGGG